MTEPTLILDHNTIQRKLDRMAVEIAEKYIDAGKVILLGVIPRGSEIADALTERIKKDGVIEVQRADIQLNKNTNNPEGITIHPEQMFTNCHVALVDDVLNTGITLFAAAAAVIKHNPASLHTVVLLDRRHRKVPVRADIVGLTLSTTLQNHIQVHTGENMAAYLV